MDPLSAGSPLEKAKTYSLPPIVDTTVSHFITFEDKNNQCDHKTTEPYTE